MLCMDENWTRLVASLFYVRNKKEKFVTLLNATEISYLGMRIMAVLTAIGLAALNDSLINSDHLV